MVEEGALKLHVSMGDWECIFLRHRRYGFFEMYFARAVGDACARTLWEVKCLIRDACSVFETLRGAPGGIFCRPDEIFGTKGAFLPSRLHGICGAEAGGKAQGKRGSGGG